MVEIQIFGKKRARSLTRQSHVDWDLYEETKRKYKSYLQSSKRHNTWKELCESFEGFPNARKTDFIKCRRRIENQSEWSETSKLRLYRYPWAPGESASLLIETNGP